MKKRKFYGWRIVAYCFFAFLMVISFNSTFPLYVGPIANDLGVSRTTVTYMPMLVGLSTLIFSLLYGVISNRFGMKKLIVAGVVLVAASYGVMSHTASLYVMYACSIVIGMSLALTTTVPLSAIVSNWFIERRGMVLGIIFSASGFAGMLFNPVVGALLNSYGWQTSFLFQGIMVAAVGLPASLLLVEKPEHIGQKALGADHKNEAGFEKVSDVQSPATEHVLGSMSYWVLVVGVFAISLSIMITVYSLPTFITDNGYNTMRAASIMSALFGLNALFKIVFGQLNDRIGVNRIMGIMFGSFLFGCFGLILLPIHIMLYLIPVLLGAAEVLLTVPMPILVQQLYGQKAYRDIMGILTASLSLGAALGPVAGSRIHDAIGNYTLTYLAAIIVMVLAVVFVIIAERTSSRLYMKKSHMVRAE